MDRRVTPPKRVTSPTWDPPPSCKQAQVVCVGFNFKHDYAKMSQRAENVKLTLEAIVKGYHECFFAVSVG